MDLFDRHLVGGKVIDSQRQLTAKVTNHTPQLVFRRPAHTPEDQAIGSEFRQESGHGANDTS